MIRTTDREDHVGRTDYAEFFRAAVTALDFGYQLRDLAAEGARRGVLDPHERVAMETRSVLPDWLRQELDLGREYPASTSYDRDQVVTGSWYRHRPARVLGDGWLPIPFDEMDVRSPDVHVTSGGPARMLTANFLSAVEVADGLVPGLSQADNLWGWQLAESRSFQHLPGHLLLLVVEGSALFSHWLLDTVPRFDVVERAGLELGRFDHVLVAKRTEPFHRETFERLDIARDRVVCRQAIGPVVSCDAFTHVSSVRNGFVGDDWVFESVHRLFGVDMAPRPERRLWISRAGAGRRRMPGEEALLEVLDRFGFEVVRTEDLGVQGAGRLFAEASVVAGPHGAGLANLAFMPPGGKVLEVYGAHLSTEYWRICESRGIEYSCLQGTDEHGEPLDREAVDQMSFFDRNHADIHLTPDRLQEALTELLGEQPRRRASRWWTPRKHGRRLGRRLTDTRGT